MSPLEAAVKDSTVLVTVGSGGVGKTTVAAALGLRAAMEGTGALVCTIDPARRLATALGLSEVGNVETRIGEEVFARAALAPRAPLSAMMLDMKRTWDELIERGLPPDKQEKIFNNRFYQALSTALAGSQEYVAMEKLCELRTGRDVPLIVLDTPPTVHALDFLEAPDRVLDFLDNDAARWLLTPALAAGRFGLRLLNLGSSYVARTISRITGTETLQQLAEFMMNISSMNESFRARAHQTRALLTAPTTGFVLVTAPLAERLDETVFFHDLLRQNRMRVVAVVVNRVHPAPQPGLAALADAVADPSLNERLHRTLAENASLAVADARAVAELRTACGETPVISVPRLSRDVHDLSSLYETSRWLWGDVTLEP